MVFLRSRDIGTDPPPGRRRRRGCFPSHHEHIGADKPVCRRAPRSRLARESAGANAQSLEPVHQAFEPGSARVHRRPTPTPSDTRARRPAGRRRTQRPDRRPAAPAREAPATGRTLRISSCRGAVLIGLQAAMASAGACERATAPEAIRSRRSARASQSSDSRSYRLRRTRSGVRMEMSSISSACNRCRCPVSTIGSFKAPQESRSRRACSARVRR